MADLMRALIQVKDPLTLFAFVSLVFLVAFRTKKVPELFFGLAKEKLTKERFSQLLHRFMLYGFVAFVLLCGSAVTGQVLALKTQAKPITLEDLRAELKNLNLPEDQKRNAESSYSDGITYIQQHDFDKAIESLQRSIDSVPSLAAQYTLAYLYQKKGDAANASTHAEAARSLANQRGDDLAQVRLDQLSVSATAQSAKDSLIGSKTPLPEGGKSFEEAQWISPGLYILNKKLEDNVLRYFKIRLKAGQTLLIKFRNPESGGHSGVAIYDADGGSKVRDVVDYASQLATSQWNVTADTVAFITIGSSGGSVANTVYRISVQ
jgi:tetratricopeptide (TPR) repeat protein